MASLAKSMHSPKARDKSTLFSVPHMIASGLSEL